MKAIAYAVALLSVALLLQAGCPSSPANPPDTTGATTGGTAGTSGDPDPVVEGTTETGGDQSGLTTAQQDLVRLLVSKQIHALQMFGTVAPLAESGTIPATDGTNEFGSCPTIQNERQGSTTGIVLTYPLPEVESPCTNDYGSFAGPVNVVIDFNMPLFTVVWNGSWVNGDYVGGTLGGTPPLNTGITDTLLQEGWITQDGKSLRGLLTFVDKEPGPQGATEWAITGYVQVIFDPDTQTVLMNRVGWLSFNEEVNKFEAEMTDVICDPPKNGNYIPYYGVLRFTPYADNSWYGKFTTLKIEFQADSPTSHAVQATFDSGTPHSVVVAADCLP